MSLNDADRALLLKVLNEVRPYIYEIGEVDAIISEESRSVRTITDFINKLQNRLDRTSNSQLQTDLRIYAGRLKKYVRV